MVIIIKDAVEVVFASALFINALMFIPQIILILRTKNVTGLSFLTFLGFNLIQVAILAHAIIKHDLILMMGMIFALITCGTITTLIIYYKHRNI